MGWRAAPMRSCSGILWRGGLQLTRCRCHQPALGANRGGVPRSATFCGRHVTVRAQPHPREWAVHGGFQAAPRSPHYWSRGHPGPANCAFCGGRGRGATDRRGAPATSGASITPSSSGRARLRHRRRRRRPSRFPVLPVSFAGAAAVSGRERPC